MDLIERLSAVRFTDPARIYSALQIPNVTGLVIEQLLLFPVGGDVAAAVDQLVEVL